ncbi:hypothetical protein OSB04_012872 [Centaurea solstitialis]|uniref:Uncharacterized protein n=1 Tax=Centaurea solstitialis TaxID=347529 RepID=A0AA38TJN8_9ASTR|nr:hypothetical protein OSB04_012872 [Centaurea solstitialis]
MELREEKEKTTIGKEIPPKEMLILRWLNKLLKKGRKHLTQRPKKLQNPKTPKGQNPNSRKMTQKANLFKGQQKRKTIPPSRHGKAPKTRKGKRAIKPAKVTQEMDTDKELSKFINYCNEVKAATAANKEGGQLSIVKHQTGGDQAKD